MLAYARFVADVFRALDDETRRVRIAAKFGGLAPGVMARLTQRNDAITYAEQLSQGLRHIRYAQIDWRNTHFSAHTALALRPSHAMRGVPKRRPLCTWV